MWFVNAAVPDRLAAAVDAFPEPRRADLWSGVGLAATFAGGCPADGLARLRAAAGDHADEVALGAVFAATARAAAGCVPEHSRIGVEVLTGGTVAEALTIAAETAVEPDDVGPGGSPAYELWRERIRSRFQVVAKAA